MENQGKSLFNALCEMLDGMGVQYDKREEELLIQSGMVGDDLPMPFIVRFDTERELVIFNSQIPFAVPEDKRDSVAIALSVINNSIVDGGFELDVENGAVLFRLVVSYKDAVLSPQVFTYMLGVSISTVDEYNDKLLFIVSRDMSVNEIVGFLTK